MAKSKNRKWIDRHVSDVYVKKSKSDGFRSRASYKLLQKIYSKRRLSILMVSHDLHLVMVSTKQVICLSNHICCSGKPQQIANDPEFLSMFGKDMAEVMAVYQHSSKENFENN